MTGPELPALYVKEQILPCTDSQTGPEGPPFCCSGCFCGIWHPWLSRTRSFWWGPGCLKGPGCTACSPASWGALWFSFGRISLGFLWPSWRSPDRLPGLLEAPGRRDPGTGHPVHEVRARGLLRDPGPHMDRSRKPFGLYFLPCGLSGDPYKHPGRTLPCGSGSSGNGPGLPDPGLEAGPFHLPDLPVSIPGKRPEDLPGMGFKSGIAAEVIGVPGGSIGEGLYMAKIYLSTADLFAWTLMIIAVSSVFEKLFLLLLKTIAGNGVPGKEENHVCFRLDPAFRVTVRDLTKILWDSLVLDHVSLNLESGCPCCLMAPSGAGKTTLFRILMGWRPLIPEP